MRSGSIRGILAAGLALLSQGRCVLRAQEDLFSVPVQAVLPAEPVTGEAVEEPFGRTFSLRVPDGLYGSLSFLGGGMSFRDGAADTFGPAGAFTAELRAGIRRIGLLAGVNVGSGKLLQNYWYKGDWPAGERYGSASPYLFGRYALLCGKVLELAPFAGIMARSLSYEYYHGYDGEDDPSLYYTRSGAAAAAGAELRIRLAGGSSSSMAGHLSLVGRAFVSRAGFPGLSGDCMAVHWGVGIDYSWEKAIP